ncbi:MAG: acyl-CoA desaturase [Cyanobacteria bacterium RYN_339]|nr:acyl-CoA desaturase [Cyanobacteria bacterium RYN_339]
MERRIAWAVVSVPALGTLAAAAWAFKTGVQPIDLALCGGMYVATMLGITAGYHRHFTHRSFQARPAVRTLLGALGSMAGQGPLLYWVAAHRRHHQHADRPGDPHSPHEGGFWHAHLTWMLQPTPEDWVRVVPDLLKDDLAMSLHLRYFAWVGVGLLIPALLGALAHRPLEGLLWGGLVRMFLVHHATWLVNSWCHLVGGRAHETADRSTNSFACALLTLGEGWHNNHHAAPAAARHGRAWWQADLTYGAIRLLERFGLASQLVGACEAKDQP